MRKAVSGCSVITNRYSHWRRTSPDARLILNNSADRHALKISMLSSLRPAALKVLEEVASAYHRQFGRRLPVSSLVRPEQYQRALRRVNRNAVLIETPPHSTGLAFDIDYPLHERGGAVVRDGRTRAFEERRAY